MSGVIAPAAEAAALAGPLRPRRRRVFRLRSFTLGSLKAFVFVRSSSSLVLAPLRFALMGFLPVDDERIARTIAAIESELMEDGFVHRLKPPRRGSGRGLSCVLVLARRLPTIAG
jgi:hypothetical protein